MKDLDYPLISFLPEVYICTDHATNLPKIKIKKFNI